MEKLSWASHHPSQRRRRRTKKKEDLGHAFRLGVREENNKNKNHSERIANQSTKSIKPNQKQTPNQSV